MIFTQLIRIDMSDKTSKPIFSLSTFSAWLGGISSAFVLAVYAYLGLFSRHLADDYCSVNFTRSNFFSALWQNYLTVSDRFSNFMLIASSEAISRNSTAILPAIMITLWVIGIAWLSHEIVRFAGSDWPRAVTLTLALLLVFFVLLQAPNRYQILYWRSAMATHFAPLVLMPFLAVFLLRTISSAAQASPYPFGHTPRWSYALAFFIAFLLGGFSEPTVAIMILLLGAALIAAWLWMRSAARGAALSLLAFTFAGAVTALLVMAIAPANSLRLHTAPPGLLILIPRSLEYAYEFSLNSIRTLPLPAFFSVLMPFLIFYSLYSMPVPVLNAVQRKRVFLVLILAPLLCYILIVGSFAPSVYGQGFPIERARFAGQFCLVAALMIEGAGLGTRLAQWRPRLLRHRPRGCFSRVGSLPLRTISSVLLMIAAIYPLRAAWLTLADVPEYRDRAVFWDARDAYVLRHAALGDTDIIVPGYSGLYGIKEWDDDPNEWVNRCAAAYYGVKSIVAVSIPDEYIWGYFNE